MARYLYVGSATPEEDGEHGVGIFVYHFDKSQGKLTKAHSVESGVNPSFLAMHPSNKVLFCVNESIDGGASSFSVDASDGNLHLINRVKVNGDYPCYASVDSNGHRLLIANYGTGSLAVLPVSDDGRLSERVQQVQHEGAATDPRRRMAAYFEPGGDIAVVVLPGAGSVPEGVVPERQERTHAHSIIFDPDDKFALAADLGMDRVWVYRYLNEKLTMFSSDQAGTTQEWQEVGWTELQSVEPQQAVGGHNLKPGSGPRHLVFHPNGRFLYVSNELSSTATVFAWNGKSGELRSLQVISTLPSGFSGQNDVAHIAFRPDGRYLYVSNRGHNSIAAFAVDPDNGLLSSAGYFSTLGNWPRNFCIDPEGSFLVAANQKSGNIVVFRINPESGALEPTGEQVIEPTPFFVMLVDL